MVTAWMQPRLGRSMDVLATWPQHGCSRDLAAARRHSRPGRSLNAFATWPQHVRTRLLAAAWMRSRPGRSLDALATWPLHGCTRDLGPEHCNDHADHCEIGAVWVSGAILSRLSTTRLGLAPGRRSGVRVSGDYICAFPFTYEGHAKRECTSVAWNMAWCVIARGWSTCAASSRYRRLVGPLALLTLALVIHAHSRSLTKALTTTRGFSSLERVVLWYFSRLEHLRSGVPDIAGLCNHWYCRMGAGLTRAFPFNTKVLLISREVQCGSAWQERQVSRPCVDMTPTRVLCRAS